MFVKLQNMGLISCNDFNVLRGIIKLQVIKCYY